MDELFGNLNTTQVNDILVAAGERTGKRKLTSEDATQSRNSKKANKYLSSWKKNGTPNSAFTSLENSKSDVLNLFRLKRLGEFNCNNHRALSEKVIVS